MQLKKYCRQICRVKGLVVLLSTYYIPVTLPVYLRLENVILVQKLHNTLMQLPVPWLSDGRLGLRNVNRIQITCNLKKTNHFLLLCCSINNPYSLLIGTTYCSQNSEEVLGRWGLQYRIQSISSGLQKGPDTTVEILQQLAVSTKTTA